MRRKQISGRIPGKSGRHMTSGPFGCRKTQEKPACPSCRCSPDLMRDHRGRHPEQRQKKGNANERYWQEGPVIGIASHKRQRNPPERGKEPAKPGHASSQPGSPQAACPGDDKDRPGQKRDHRHDAEWRQRHGRAHAGKQAGQKGRPAAGRAAIHQQAVPGAEDPAP